MDVTIPPGVTRGASPNDRTGRWFDSNLVRFRSGRVEPVGGWERLTLTPLPSTPRRIHASTSNTDIRRTFVGCDSHLIMTEGGSVFDRTPTAFIPLSSTTGLPTGFGVGAFGSEAWNTPRTVGSPAFLRAQTWSIDTYGEDVLAVASTDGRLIRWSASSPNSAFAVVAGAPTSNRAMCVTPERHILLVGAGGNRRRVQWSTRENPSDWNASSVEGTSGFLDLDTDGLLVGLAEVQGGTLVFSDESAWLIEWVGGEFVYRQRVVGQGLSLLSPRTVTTVGGRAFWMGKNGFWMYEGGVVRPMPSEVSEYVFDDIDPVASVLSAHGSHNGLFQEIWWFWPTRGSLEPNRYCIYNYVENTWAVGSLARTAILPAGLSATPIMAGTDRNLYSHESGWTNAGLPRIGTVWIESAAFASETGMAVMQAEADSGEGVDATQIRAFARQTRDGTDVSFGPFPPNPDGRTPMRAGGKNLRVRLEARHDGPWSVGRMVFDVKPIGSR